MIKSFNEIKDVLRTSDVKTAKLTWFTRKNELEVIALELIGKPFNIHVNYSERVAENLADIDIKTLWPDDFPEKLCVKLNDDGVYITPCVS